MIKELLAEISPVLLTTISGLMLWFLKGILTEIRSLRVDINNTIIVQNGLKIELEFVKSEIKDIKTQCKEYHKKGE